MTRLRLVDFKTAQDRNQTGPPTPEIAMADVYCLTCCGHVTRARDLASKLFEHYTADGRNEDDARQAMIALGMRHALDGILAYKAQNKRSK